MNPELSLLYDVKMSVFVNGVWWIWTTEQLFLVEQNGFHSVRRRCVSTGTLRITIWCSQWQKQNFDGHFGNSSSSFLSGKLPSRSDRQLGVSRGADDGSGRSGVSADPSPSLPVGSLRVAPRRRAGGRREPARWSPCQQRGDLHVSRQLPGRLVSGERTSRRFSRLFIIRSPVLCSKTW